MTDMLALLRAMAAATIPTIELTTTPTISRAAARLDGVVADLTVGPLATDVVMRHVHGPGEHGGRAIDLVINQAIDVDALDELYEHARDLTGCATVLAWSDDDPALCGVWVIHRVFIDADTIDFPAGQVEAHLELIPAPNAMPDRPETTTGGPAPT